MADKLNDQEIVDELKRFGETVKVPIDRKRRPILIKKLNHHYAKEKTPVKRGRPSVKSTRRPVIASEFSDDSQDESESVVNHNAIKHSPERNKAANNSNSRQIGSRLRNRTLDNGATSPSNSPGLLSNLRGRNAKSKKLVASPQQMEVYPDEFSDNDSAEESVYVEEKSIGINTTMNYDDDDDDEEESNTSNFTNMSISTRISPRGRPSNRYNDVNISTISRPNTSSNNIGAKQGQTSYSKDEIGQIISKSILAVVAIFFVILAVCYLYVRRDIFFSHEAAFSDKDLKEFIFKEANETYTYTKADVNKGALPVIKEIHRVMASRKGKYELGEVAESEIRMTKQEVSKYIDSKWDAEKMTRLCFLLILKYPGWDILAFSSDGSEAETSSEVAELESVHGDLPVSSRLLLAFYKVLLALAIPTVCVILGVLGIYYLRWQNRQKEKQLQKVYEMVEKIIDMLKENYELAESKNDNKNYPAYMAVQHIRDQLIPVAQRRRMRSLWDEAVKFIETNESRIRVETQVIQGEEFTVWRWLQAMPNGHKMWQGRAFGENSQTSLNSLPYGPTPCLKVRNMFDANMEKNTDDWHVDIEESILEKCKDNNGILHIFVDRTSKEGCVYIKCGSCEKAYEAYQALHGFWFDERLLSVKYLRLEHYHDRFPDSRNCRHPLQPSKPDKCAVSRPYRSVLEMT